MRKMAVLSGLLYLAVCLPLALSADTKEQEKLRCKSRIAHTGFAEFVLPKEGGTHKLVIKTGESVKWTVQNSAYIDWISILGGSSGTGPGTMTIQLEANPEASCRVGELAIAGIVPIYGLPIRILQEGAGTTGEKIPETSIPGIVVLESFSRDQAQTPGARPYKRKP